jgi:hypothetical protein
MRPQLPDDANGDAIRKLISTGNDLDRPMYVDFQVAVPTEEAGNNLAKAAKKLGYKTKVYASNGCELPWTCECSTRMLATYQCIVAFEQELGELASPYGGFPDGWGSFGNARKRS